MTDLTNSELAYMAGLLDAVGNITSITTDAGTDLPRIEISSANTELLDVFAAATGTKRFQTSRTYDRHRCTEHCREAHDHIASKSQRWQISGAKATVVLWALMPYLRQKHAVAANLAWVGAKARYTETALRRMVDLGWPCPPTWFLEDPVQR